MNEFEKRIEAEIERRPSPKRGVKQHLVRDLIKAVLKIKNETDARDFFDGYMDHLKIVESSDRALSIARSNIGWCFGEGMSPDKITMWRRVCEAAHPALRFSPEGNPPSADECLQAGMELVKN